MITKEQILEKIFFKPETQDWYKPVLKAMDEYAIAYHEQQVKNINVKTETKPKTETVKDERGVNLSRDWG